MHLFRDDACVCAQPPGWLFWRNEATGANSIWKMEGPWLAARYAINSLVGASWSMATVGDFDGDGADDLVWRNRATGANVVWFLRYGARPGVSGGAELPAQQVTSEIIVGAGDLDRDGHDDIVWRDRLSGAITVWYMDGVRLESTASLPATVGEGWQLVGIGDLDGDRGVDLLWRHDTSGHNVVWLMEDRERVGVVHLPVSPNVAWWVRAVTDLDGDGGRDIVWRNEETGELSVWLMRGAILRTSAVLPTASDVSWQLAGPRSSAISSSR